MVETNLFTASAKRGCVSQSPSFLSFSKKCLKRSFFFQKKRGGGGLKFSSQEPVK